MIVDLRDAEQALLESTTWQTAAVYTAHVDGATGAVHATQVHGDDLPHDIELRPMRDWITLLGGRPDGLGLEVLGVKRGPDACGLPPLPIYTAPDVSCVIVVARNETGLDIPSVLLEAFALKGSELPAYDAPAGNMVPTSMVTGDTPASATGDPGPLWLLEPDVPTALALPLGDDAVKVGWRLLIQSEVCDNGVDDDRDGRVDEACRAMPTGAACDLDLDCASGLCRSNVCAADDGRWVTHGVFELDWASLKGNEQAVRSVPITAWPAGYVAADPKTADTTRLFVEDVADSPVGCDVPQATPYTNRGVLCGRLSAAIANHVVRRPMMLEWIGGDGAAPYEEPFQRDGTFESLPYSQTGMAPVAEWAFPLGPPRRPGGKAHVLSREARPRLAGETGSRSLFRIVSYEQPTGGTKDWDIEENPSLPGADQTYPNFCLDARNEAGDPLPIDRADVYDVVAEFELILEEIGWTPTYLTNEFVARARGESTAYDGLFNAFGDAALERAFGEATVDLMRAGSREAVNAISRNPFGWADLLRPDPTGEFDSYWGLRALAEHGSLTNHAIDRVYVGCNRVQAADGPVAFSRYEICPAHRDRPAQPPPLACHSGQPARGSTAPAACTLDGSSVLRTIPWPRHYVLPTGDYVVRQTESLALRSPYHGPMPDYCTDVMSPSPAGRRAMMVTAASNTAKWQACQDDPSALDDIDGENCNEYGDEPPRPAQPVPLAEIANPAQRFGWPRLTFYGWENVSLNGCDSTISFEWPGASNGGSVGLPVSEDDEGRRLIPACVSEISTTASGSGASASVRVDVRPAVSYGSLHVLGADRVTIGSLTLSAPLARTALRWSGVNPASRNPYHPADDGYWNELEALGFDVSLWRVTCMPESDADENPDNDFASIVERFGWDTGPNGLYRTIEVNGTALPIANITDNRATMSSALITGDTNGLRLEDVSAMGGWDGAVFGADDDQPGCPTFWPRLSSEAANGRRDPDDEGMIDQTGRLQEAIEYVPPSGGEVPALLAPTLDIHEGSALRAGVRPARYPTARFSVPGVCDALNCFDTELLVHGGTFEGFARNSATLGAVRRAVFEDAEFVDAGANSETGFFLTSPNAGINVEPNYTRSNPRVRLTGLASGADVPIGVLKTGQINLVNVSVTGNMGWPLSVYSSWGRVEDVRVMDSLFSRDERARRSGVVSTTSFGTDFVNNWFFGNRDESTVIWADGASGIFEDNVLYLDGDIQFGQAALCGAPNAARAGTRGEAALDAATADFESRVDTACAAAYEGASPTARCADVQECDPVFRPAVVTYNGTVTALTVDEVAFLTSAGDLPWSSVQQERAVRSVRNNRLLLTPRFLADATTPRWTGTSADFEADIVADNQVCFNPANLVAAGDATTPSVRIGAPASPWLVDGNDWASTAFFATCRVPAALAPHVDYSVPPDSELSPFWAGDVCLNEPDGDCTYVFDDTTEAGTLLCGDEAPPVGDDRPPRDVSYGDDCEGGAACITDPDDLLMCEAEYDRRHGWYVYCPEAEPSGDGGAEATARYALVPDYTRLSSGSVVGGATRDSNQSEGEDCWVEGAGMDRLVNQDRAELYAIEEADLRRAYIDEIGAAERSWWFPPDRYGALRPSELEVEAEPSGAYLRPRLTPWSAATP